MKPTPAAETFSEAEAAEYLRTTPRKLRRLRSEGRIRYSRVGKTPIFRREHLDEFLDRNEVRQPRR